MDELTPEQEEAVAATVRIAMAVVELPRNNARGTTLWSEGTLRRRLLSSALKVPWHMRG
jgi:hypothetical protein